MKNKTIVALLMLAIDAIFLCGAWYAFASGYPTVAAIIVSTIIWGNLPRTAKRL